MAEGIASTTNRGRRRRARPADRRGATLVEMAIVMMLFLTLVLGMMDLAIGVFRYNLLAQAARQGARAAIVHGEFAPAGFDGGPWGPAGIPPTSVNSLPYAALRDKIQSSLVGFDLADPDGPKVAVEWLAATNEYNTFVRVTVSAKYTPIMTFIFGSIDIPLSASSTMAIAH